MAEEIIQQIFGTIWEKRKLIGNSDIPEKYVSAICKSCVYTHFRTKARDYQLKAELFKQVSVNQSLPDLILQEKEKKSHLKKTLEKLPSQQQLVCRMSRNTIAAAKKLPKNEKFHPIQ